MLFILTLKCSGNPEDMKQITRIKLNIIAIKIKTWHVLISGERWSRARMEYARSRSVALHGIGAKRKRGASITRENSARTSSEVLYFHLVIPNSSNDDAGTCNLGKGC